MNNLSQSKKDYCVRKRTLLLATVVMTLIAVPTVSYAQFGALANMAKGKAVEMLTDGVMKELEKKFTEIVAKEPISETAKANTVKKLSEIARPTVKRFIDGAASGKLPNPMELAQTVLKDILPRVPEIVAAAKAEEGGGTAAAAPAQQGTYGQQATYGAIPQPAQNMPKIAVYVFGTEDMALHKAMTMRLIAALSNSGRYNSAKNYKEFFEYAVMEQQKYGAVPLYSEQIRQIGKLFGEEYVCVAEITTVFDELQVSAHILNVETADIIATGAGDVSLKTLGDLTTASEQIVKMMFQNAPPPMPPPPIVAAPVYTLLPPAPAYAPAPQPIAAVRSNYQTDYPSEYLEDFTGHERFGTWFLNLLVPGLGSGTIMHDGVGVGFQLGLTTLGWGLIARGAAKDESVLFGLGVVTLATNFVFNIERSATYIKPQSQLASKRRRVDYYFAPKYQLPVGTPVSWGGVNTEVGLIWGDGAFLGIDFSFGSSDYGNSSYRSYSEDRGSLIGFGLSLGNAYDFGNQWQFVYGMSVGYWVVIDKNDKTEESYGETYYDPYYDDYQQHYYNKYNWTHIHNDNFLAPFVKLRWSVLEITYRGLLGIKEKDYGNSTFYGNGNNYNSYDKDFSWNNHQLMLGLYFATSKRERR